MGLFFGMIKLAVWSIKLMFVMCFVAVYLIAFMFLLLALPFSRNRAGINRSLNRMSRSMSYRMRHLM